MEQENKSFIHDTINLDEIRMLLGDSAPEDTVLAAELEEAAEAPVEELAADLIQQDDISDEDEFDIPACLLAEDTAETVDAAEPAELDEEVSSQEDNDGEDIDSAMMQSEPASVDPVSEETEVKEKKKASAAEEFHLLLHDVVYLLAAVALVFVFLVRLVGVKGDSMLPTLQNVDFLLLESNFLYKGDDMKYGDIVVLNVPYYEEQGDGPIVKRIIATEGETVDIDFDTGAVYVNGVMLTETYINDPTYYNWDGEYALDYPAVVPENCIFVLGDNRNNSMDSRYAPIGMIDERSVLGKVLFILLPGQTVDELGNVITPRDWGRIGLVS